MMIEDEVLSAYIDGELGAEETETLEAALQSDPEIMARLANLRRADHAIQTAYRSIDNRPMPQAVLDLLGDNARISSANVIAFPSLQSLKNPSGWVAAMAATLAIVAGGAAIMISANKTPAGMRLAAGTVERETALYNALETAPSGALLELATGETINPVLTFRSMEGEFCREFVLERKGGAQRALACRNNSEDWSVRISVAETPGSTDGFTTAASETEYGFDIAVDRMIAGAPLDAKEERDLIESGWATQD